VINIHSIDNRRGVDGGRFLMEGSISTRTKRNTVILVRLSDKYRVGTFERRVFMSYWGCLSDRLRFVGCG
jgi:hypothetical protein